MTDDNENLPVKHPGGRPVKWTEERQEEAKILYLELLAKGFNEREIDEADGVPDWKYRAVWKRDPEFYRQCQEARSHGVHKTIRKANHDLMETIENAKTGIVDPVLAGLIKTQLEYAKWLAKNVAPRDFAEVKQVQNTHEGVKDGHPVEVNVNFVAPDGSKIIDVTPTEAKDKDE
jgi:hypothetical protein